MPAIRFPLPDFADGLAPLAFGDDYGIAGVENCLGDREDEVWADLPVPVSLNLPLDDPVSCEVVLPAHYEPRYAYPLLTWLAPPVDVDFRECVSAISDRNYIGLALHWSGFVAGPSQSVPRAAECARLVESAVATTSSLWNIHTGRRFLIGAGPAACDWVVRLAEYCPEGFHALVCIDPAERPHTSMKVRSARSLSEFRMPTLLLTTAERDDQGAIDSWRRLARERRWAMEHQRLPRSDASTLLPKQINSWLMSRVCGR